MTRPPIPALAGRMDGLTRQHDGTTVVPCCGLRKAFYW